MTSSRARIEDRTIDLCLQRQVESIAIKGQILPLKDVIIEEVVGGSCPPMMHMASSLTTRTKTIEHTTSLIAKNAEFKAQLQEKGFAIAALKTELRKLTGNSVNTKFAKSSILRKPVLQPHINQSFVRQPTAFKSERPRILKPRFAFQVDVNNDLSKPVTTHYLPKEREVASAKPHHMIAPVSSRYSSNDMVHNHYLEESKKQTHEIGRNSKTSVIPSARSQSTTNGSKPKPRINNQKSRN
ncbi:hypothetical protein Tco_1004710 [Tanacetum coccineum]|uniref:Uncharacterized protein n=1 Tax=Tanacetum coccineum TaxID=301880 RepID=A0ABQ5FF50_9ASTR